MTDPTLSDFRARFPEFAAETFPDATVTGAIETATQITVVSEDATLYCAAHLLSLRSQETAKPDGGAGEVKWEMQGRRQVQYVTQSKDGDGRAFFSTTAYGRMVLTLHKASPRLALSALVV